MEPGGAPSMSSAFILLLENTRRGEKYMLVAFMQVTFVTSEPLSPGDKEGTVA
jgi:hypothetical protein